MLTPEGKLLDGVMRNYLGQLACRACIGVLGRPSSGKSLLLSHLAAASLEGAEGETTSFFPLATEKNKIGTQGVDFWVTPARIILVDSPPVMSLVSDEARRLIRGDSRGPLSKSSGRARDLQLTTLLIRISSVLLVFIEYNSGGVDEGLVKLLVDARTILGQFPGPKHHYSNSSRVYPHSGMECKLHIVINQYPEVSEDLDAIAKGYEKATGYAVSGVSVIPSRSPPLRVRRPLMPTVVPRFQQVAESWSVVAPSELPLYPPPLEMSTKSVAGEKGVCQSLLCWPSLAAASKTFEEAVDDLRARVLAPPSLSSSLSLAAGWDAKPEGEWMSTCLNVWDAIRRSHKLRDYASGDF
ncbi:smg-9, nonsense mediated mRNA decay factor [Coemansia aciculifera]|nr:smg-9, nonsense mediated mRNA decay factor [Coemansia aciculifera]